MRDRLQPPKLKRFAMGWRSSMSARQTMSLAEALADLLSAGLALDIALTVCISLPWPTKVIAGIRRLAAQTHQGQLLSIALQRDGLRWPPMFIAWVRVGEQTGQLAKALQHYHRTQHQFSQHQQRWWRSLSYPLLVLVVTIIAIIVMAHSLGEVQHTLPNATSSITFITTTNPLSSPSLSTVDWLGLIGLAVLLVAYPLQRWQGNKRRPEKHQQPRDLAGPAWRPGHLQQLNSIAATMSSLGLMLSSGLHLSEALHQVTTGLTSLLVRCPGLHSRLNALTIDVQRGHSLSMAFRQHQWPTSCQALARLAEHTGDLAQLFMQIGCLYRRRAEVMQQRLEQWTAPGALLLATLMLVIAYQRYIAPLYDSLLEWQS